MLEFSSPWLRKKLLWLEWGRHLLEFSLTWPSSGGDDDDDDDDDDEEEEEEEDDDDDDE